MKDTKSNTTLTNTIKSNTTVAHKDNKINAKAMVKMIMEKANKHEGDEAHKDKKVKQYEVRYFLDVLAECMSASLKSEKSVFLPKVGVFQVQEKKATRRRNPQNGQFIAIPKRKAVKCRFFKSFSTKTLTKEV